MVNWTSLSIVESTRASSKQALFAPSMVYAVNWVSQNPFLAKFTYATCCICHKLMKHGRHCHHEAQAEVVSMLSDCALRCRT